MCGKAHKPPDETEIKTSVKNERTKGKDEWLKIQCEQVRESLPSKTERAVELAHGERSYELVDGDPDKGDEF